MGESVIRMKPIARENEKIRAKTGEQKMFSPEMAVKMLKRKKKWAKETWNFRPLYIEDSRMHVIKLPKSGKRSREIEFLETNNT